MIRRYLRLPMTSQHRGGGNPRNQNTLCLPLSVGSQIVEYRMTSKQVARLHTGRLPLIIMASALTDADCCDAKPFAGSWRNHRGCSGRFMLCLSKRRARCKAQQTIVNSGIRIHCDMSTIGRNPAIAPNKRPPRMCQTPIIGEISVWMSRSTTRESLSPVPRRPLRHTKFSSERDCIHFPKHSSRQSYSNLRSGPGLFEHKNQRR